MNPMKTTVALPEPEPADLPDGFAFSGWRPDHADALWKATIQYAGNDRPAIGIELVLPFAAVAEMNPVQLAHYFIGRLSESLVQIARAQATLDRAGGLAAWSRNQEGHGVS